VSNQKYAPVGEELHRLCQNLWRHFGSLRQGLVLQEARALPPPAVTEIPSASHQRQSAQERDHQVSVLCDEIRDECLRLEEIQAAFGYRRR